MLYLFCLLLPNSSARTRQGNSHWLADAQASLKLLSIAWMKAAWQIKRTVSQAENRRYLSGKALHRNVEIETDF